MANKTFVFAEYTLKKEGLRVEDEINEELADLICLASYGDPGVHVGFNQFELGGQSCFQNNLRSIETQHCMKWVQGHGYSGFHIELMEADSEGCEFVKYGMIELDLDEDNQGFEIIVETIEWTPGDFSEQYLVDMLPEEPDIDDFSVTDEYYVAVDNWNEEVIEHMERIYEKIIENMFNSPFIDTDTEDFYFSAFPDASTNET